jgi:ubiquitin carboxyl-terminal hydrolase 25/28
MEYCETAAVTPALELAKLALVTSKDEEEDEADKGGTDSSNDTDATLVEDGSSRFPIPESSDSAQSLSSVLGKRPRDTPSAMEVDSPLVESPQEKDGFMIVSQPNAPSRSDTPPPPLEQAGPSTRNRVTTPLDGDGDAVMSDARVEEGPSQKAPSVPARKAEVSDSVMMFGKFYLLWDTSCTLEHSPRPATRCLRVYG